MTYKLKEFERGVILVNKPVGITSFGVVSRVRRYLLSQGGSTNEGPRVQGFKSLKVGHTGTLDSMASGLLIILVGEATKRQGDFTRLPKEYEGEFALGVESDTYSADGQLRFYPFRKTATMLPSTLPLEGGGKGGGESPSLHPGDGVLPTDGGLSGFSTFPLPPGEGVSTPGERLESLVPHAELIEHLSSVKRVQIESLFKKFQGEQEQVVPPFSAVQVKGERLHRLARRGRPLPELPRRRISIERLELVDFHPIVKDAEQARPLRGLCPEEFLNIAPKIRFMACVSSGTYVRSLVVDIGKELGTGAVLTLLTRTRVGPYRLSDAIDLPIGCHSDPPGAGKNLTTRN